LNQLQNYYAILVIYGSTAIQFNIKTTSHYDTLQVENVNKLPSEQSIFHNNLKNTVQLISFAVSMTNSIPKDIELFA